MIKGKTILITGASDGIGEQISLKLAESGVNLILLARDKSRLEKVKLLCENLGSKVIIYVCDLRNQSEIANTVKNIETKSANIDGLINNAGIWQKLGQIDDLGDENISDIINTNLTGLIILTKQILPLIRKSKVGFIINISSRSGVSAQAGQAIYTASKFGVQGFTKVLREDLKDFGIRVAGIYQGGTNTKMFEKAGESWPSEKYKNFIPAGELAEIVRFIITRPKHVWIPEIHIENK